MSEITWYCDACNADCEDFGVIFVSCEDTRKSKAYMDAVAAEDMKVKSIRDAKTTEKMKKAQIKVDKYKKRLV